MRQPDKILLTLAFRVGVIHFIVIRQTILSSNKKKKKILNFLIICIIIKCLRLCLITIIRRLF